VILGAVRRYQRTDLCRLLAVNESLRLPPFRKLLDLNGSWGFFFDYLTIRRVIAVRDPFENLTEKI